MTPLRAPPPPASSPEGETEAPTFDTSGHAAQQLPGPVPPRLAGLELVEPGLVRVQQWRPDSEAEAGSPAALWGGVARKG